MSYELVAGDEDDGSASVRPSVCVSVARIFAFSLKQPMADGFCRAVPGTALGRIVVESAAADAAAIVAGIAAMASEVFDRCGFTL